MNRYFWEMRHRGPDEARVVEHLLRCTIEPEGCWHWQMATTLDYGRVKFHGRLDMAHRVSYLLWVGELIAGMEIDHLCRNRWCVNPEHLEQVTPLVNQLRSSARQRYCKRGHEFTPGNVYVAPRTGSRNCRECKALCDAARRHRRVAVSGMAS